MKNVVILLNVLFLICGLFFTSCQETKVHPPNSLQVSSIIDTAATLSWKGSADYYEFKIGTKTYISTPTTFRVGGLKNNTTYTWKIRAIKGSTDISSWVNGPKFTTLDRN